MTKLVQFFVQIITGFVHVRRYFLVVGTGVLCAEGLALRSFRFSSLAFFWSKLCLILVLLVVSVVVVFLFVVVLLAVIVVVCPFLLLARPVLTVTQAAADFYNSLRSSFPRRSYSSYWNFNLIF